MENVDRVVANVEAEIVSAGLEWFPPTVRVDNEEIELHWIRGEREFMVFVLVEDSQPGDTYIGPMGEPKWVHLYPGDWVRGFRWLLLGEVPYRA